MNKSTPLNQLPSNPTMQGNFINDSQRQIVTNAQQAVATMNMSINTQLQSEPIDDDMEIQEALNDVNSQLGVNSQQQQQQQQHAPPIAAIRPDIPHHQIPNIPIENQSDIMFMQGAHYAAPTAMQHMMPQMHMAPTPAVVQIAPSPPSIMEYVVRFADDLKLALAIVVVVVAVHFIPFDTLLGKYIALEKIPYHDVLLRAFFAALTVVALKHFLM